MMVRFRDKSPLARTRSWLSVASSAKPCSWKPLVQPCWRGGLERFLRRSTRIFFFLAIVVGGARDTPYRKPCSIASNDLQAFSVTVTEGVLPTGGSPRGLCLNPIFARNLGLRGCRHLIACQVPSVFRWHLTTTRRNLLQ